MNGRWLVGSTVTDEANGTDATVLDYSLNAAGEWVLLVKLKRSERLASWNTVGRNITVRTV